MSSRPHFNQVAIIGLGLIGGSLALALRRRRLARCVIGFSRHEATIHRAKSRGAIHDGDTELCPNWLGESDLVVIATPPRTVVPLVKEVARLTKHSFILTDVASTKGQIVSQLERTLPSRISFVGSHPMAGSERSGMDAAKADLFKGAVCIVTKTRRTKKSALGKVNSLWRAVGGRPITLTPEAHDHLVAEVSHVPHLTAAALTLAAENEALPLAAGGFRDATRLALSDPELWSDIAKTNVKEITRALDDLMRRVRRIRGFVVSGRSSDLRKELAAAQRKRQRISR